MKKRVLFVDDEPNVLTALKRSLRPMASEWDMHFAGGGVEALDKLAENPFDVIVTDIRMPEMDGIQLLEQVRDKFPQAIRIALSGQTSSETSLRSAGPAHQFLSKPCDPAILISSVQRASNLRQILTQDSLQQLIAGITTLPSLPNLYNEIVTELHKPTASMKRISELVSSDVAMTAKLLQLVNSSFFGLPQRVANVSQAVVLLGAETIKALTLTVGVFSQCPGSAKLIDPLVSHSVLVGRFARSIAESERMPKPICDDAFMAGVLHDVGKLVLISSFPEAYEESRKLAEEFELGALDVERQVFGANHAEVGAALLSLWAFPDPTVEAVAFHHQPSKSISPQFTPLTAVHAANALAASGAEADPTTLDCEYLSQLQLEVRLEAWKEKCFSPVA